MMKETIKKSVIAIFMAFSICFATAAMPVLAVPDNGSGYSDTDTGETVPTPIAAGVSSNNTVASGAAQQTADRSGVSVGTVVVLMILTIMINAVISFVVSNRFYKMSRRDSHLQAELRALKRDIDTKFSGNVTELHERSVTVKNTNKDYSRGAGAISYKEEPKEVYSEISKKWNIQLEEEPERKVYLKTASPSREEYQKRRDSRIAADDDVSDGVKSKARKFLGEIFPSEE